MRYALCPTQLPIKAHLPQPSPSPAPSTRPVTAVGSGVSQTDDGDLYLKYKRLQKKLEFLQVWFIRVQSVAMYHIYSFKATL